MAQHADPARGNGSGWQSSGVLPLFAGSVAFLSLIQVFSTVTGAARIAMGQSLAAVGLAACAFGAIAFGAWFREPAGLTEHEPPEGSCHVARWSDRVLWLAAALVLLWALWVWFQAWILAIPRSPYGFDSFSYHLPAVHGWVRRGHVAFVGEVPESPFVNLPMGVELTSFYVHQLTGTDRLLTAANLWYWPLAATALAVISAVLGVKGMWRWLAGSLVFGASAFVALSLTFYIDPGFAATVMAAVAASMALVFPRARDRWRDVLLFGLAVGLMLGSKGFGLPFAAAIFALSSAVLLASGGRGRIRCQMGRLAVAGTIVVLIGGYWYLRNLIVAGNPIFPIQLGFGHKVLAAGFNHWYWDDWATPEWLVDTPYWLRMFVVWLQPDAPVHYIFNYSGLGYIWLFGGLPAFMYLWILAIRRGDSRLVRRLGFLTLLVVPLLGLVNMAWYARYTLWLHALGLPCLVAVLHDAVSRWRRSPAHLITITLGLAVIGVAVRESNRTLRLERDVARDPSAPADQLAFKTSLEAGYPGMETSAGFEQALGVRKLGRARWETTPGILLSGALAMPLGYRDIIPVPPASGDWSNPYAEAVNRPDPKPTEILALYRDGVRWFLWDSSDGESSPEALRPWIWESYRYDVLGGNYIHVARLRPPPQVGVR